MLFEADPTSAADVSVGYGSLMTFRQLRVTTPRNSAILGSSFRVNEPRSPSARYVILFINSLA